MFTKEEPALLKAGSQVLPGLADWDGKLRYEPDKCQKILLQLVVMSFTQHRGKPIIIDCFPLSSLY